MLGMAVQQGSLSIHPEAIEEASQAWRAQEAALRRTRREVALVEEALRGATFVRRL